MSVSRRTVLVGGSLAAAAVAGLQPTPAHAARNEQRWITATIGAMTPEQKIGQLFVQEVYGSTPDTADARNLPQYGVETPREVVETLHLGGVIYFAWTDSYVNPEQVATLSNGLQEAALSAKGGAPLFIATDQEQGVVTRFGPPATQFPGSMALGAGRSATDARTAAAITGQELRAVGINVDFAPVSDVNVNAENPVIGVRAFSSDPTLTAELVAAQVDGYQVDGQVCSSTKHFPGHGDTATDSHTGLPVITHSREEWERIDAPPFIAAMERGVDMVMTAHLLVPALDDSDDPATLSHTIMTGILRDELGYDGVLITDGLMMAAIREKYGDAEVAVRALEAGVDQLLMAPKPLEARDAIMDALRSGRLRWRDIDAKLRRILRAKYRRGIVARPLADLTKINSIVGTDEHEAAAAYITDHTVTLIKNDAGTLPLSVAGTSVLVTGYGVSTTRSVADELIARGATTTVLQTGTRPTEAQIAEVVSAAGSHDTVVVLTNKAWDTKVTDPEAGQQRLVTELHASGATLVVVAVRDPYDINTFDEIDTYVATYSYSPVAPPALVRMLTGEVPPIGKLPVDIPVSGSTGVLYSFGHGLGY
ncbi:glycoside hydrolase family 3 protein [Propionibacteriaceae bacterium Y2011]